MDKLLIIVDMQYDFANPKGNLYVHNGETIIKDIDKLAKKFKDEGNFVIASRDWHPTDHCSFKDNGGEWPFHCVQKTEGAKLVIDESNIDIIINKGMNKLEEEYSCIKTGHIYDLVRPFKEIYVCGLALDFCVLNTAIALPDEIDVKIIKNLTKAVYPDKNNELEKHLAEYKNIKIIDKYE